jgi:hypothetical protein
MSGFDCVFEAGEYYVEYHVWLDLFLVSNISIHHSVMFDGEYRNSRPN